MARGIWILAFLLLVPRSTAAQDVAPANVSSYLGNGTWSWTIFLTGPNELLDSINYVEYTLHPTFPNPLQRVDRGADPRFPFGFTATGWGVFEVRIKIVFKNAQVRYTTHMLQFVPPSTQNTCGPTIKLINQRPLMLPDSRFKDAVYLYVDEIHNDWTRRHPTLTVFYGYSGTWKKDKAGQYLYVSPADFESQTKYVPSETKWSLKIQKEGDGIQFRYANTYYLLTVTKVTVNLERFNYLDLQVCERPPVSAK